MVKSGIRLAGIGAVELEALGAGDADAVGVRGLVILKRPLALVPETDVASVVRREGAAEDVERAKPDIVRARNSGCALGDNGVLGLVSSPCTTGFASPSVHCKCKMADLVAHWQTISVNIYSR